MYFIKYTFKIIRLSVEQWKHELTAMLHDVSEPTIAGYLSKQPEVSKLWCLDQAGN